MGSKRREFLTLRRDATLTFEGPRVVEEAANADVGADGVLVKLVQVLFKGEGAGKVAGEGNRAGAEFGFGVKEDRLIDELGAKEGAVEGGAGFEQNGEEFCLVEMAEEFGEVEASGGGWERGDETSGFGKGGEAVGRGGGGAEDPEVLRDGMEEFGGEICW